MKKMMIWIVAMMMTGAVMAQDAQQEKVAEELTGKELRKQKRAERKAIFEEKKQEGKALIEQRDFVLMAERLSGKNNIPQIVPEDVNFIKIDGDELTIQYGSFFAIGSNGLGGATFKGTIEKLELTDQGEGKPLYASIQFSTPFLNNITTINLTIQGDQARAAVWNNGRNINFEGVYASNEASRIHVSEITRIF